MLNDDIILDTVECITLVREITAVQASVRNCFYFYSMSSFHQNTALN